MICYGVGNRILKNCSLSCIVSIYMNVYRVNFNYRIGGYANEICVDKYFLDFTYLCFFVNVFEGEILDFLGSYLDY